MNWALAGIVFAVLVLSFFAVVAVAYLAMKIEDMFGEGAAVMAVILLVIAAVSLASGLAA